MIDKLNELPKESNYTPFKNYVYLQIFEKLFWLMEIGVFNKYKYNTFYYPYYVYIDITAGNGKQSNKKNSGLIEILETSKRRKFPLHLFAIESNENTYLELMENIETYKNYDFIKIKLFNKDHKEALLQIYKYLKNKNKKIYGHLYFDPNGDIPYDTFNILKNLSNKITFDKIDYIINLSATNCKRKRKVGINNKYLEDLLFDINKDKIFLRDPYKEINLIEKNKKYFKYREQINYNNILIKKEKIIKQEKILSYNTVNKAFQWTFFLLTNDNKNTTNRKITSIGFYDLDTDKGEEIFNILNHTKEELNERYSEN